MGSQLNINTTQSPPARKPMPLHETPSAAAGGFFLTDVEVTVPRV